MQSDLLYLVVVEVEFLQPLYLMEGAGRDLLDGAARNIQGDDLGHLHVAVMEGKDTLIDKKAGEEEEGEEKEDE